MPWRCTALKDLDDDHAAAAAWTSRLAGIDAGSGRLALRFCNGEQLARPKIIKNFGVSDTQTGLLSALPFVFGAIGMVLLGRHSDRTTERKGHVAVALSMAAIGIGLSGVVSNPVIIMALLCFAQIGVSAVPPMFWPLPASFLTGASAAAGIAAINSLGNLSGFAGPYAMGYLKDLTGSFTIGLLLLAGFAVLGAVVVLSLGIDVKREQSSGNVALAH